ncbi:hypothetical protein EDB85DRAFT_2290373 [Lactarius pseudohatsudake]|nr:hypothetical protein EDB85DRAFT_2290373 [Lactarius pseudohatsudake]
MIGELPIVGGKWGIIQGSSSIKLSALYAAEAATVLQWPPFLPRQTQAYLFVGPSRDNRLHHGVRALALFLDTCFLSGALNGNIGVSKNVLAELTDDSNVTRGFSLLPLVAVDRWPDTFCHPFWSEYPYFLPCLVVAGLSFTQFTLTAIFFEEALTANSLR